MSETAKPETPGDRKGDQTTRRTVRTSQSHRAARLSAILLLIVFCGLRAWDPLPIEALRLKTFDLFQIIQPRAPSAQPALIVDIDEKSLRELGQWPWPRDTLAWLVSDIRNSGARVIAFDVLFAESDRLSPANIVAQFGEIPPQAAELLRRLPSNDKKFADAIRGANVVLGQATSSETQPINQVGKEKPTTVAIIGADPRPYLLRFPSTIHNVRILERAAAGIGLFALGVEPDNIVRRVPAVYRIENEIYPSLVTEMLRVNSGQTAYAIRSNEAGIDSIVVGKHKFTTDQRGRIWVHYTKHTRDRYVSASDVIKGRLAPDFFKGRMVLIGTSAAGLLDLKATPVARSMPGVEVHAQLLETILEGRGLNRPNFALGAEIILLLITSILIIIFVPLLGAKWTLAIGAFIEAPLFGGAWYAYTAHSMLIDVAYPAMAAMAIYLMLTAINYLHGETEKRRIRTAFSRYLSPELVARLAQTPSELKLGGEQKEMSLLFTDIHGFTGISENYEAVDLTNLVNAIFTPLTHAIFEGGGTVDKYMGDSIMAFWNAPLDDPDHARHACLSALEMQRRIPVLNETLALQAETRGIAFRPVKLGIGINTGDCCVGNMGSDLRFDYSVLGDTVNIAARLEGQTRAYKVHNVIGETTWQLVPEFAFLELDLVTVLGKTTPVRIFTLLGDHTFAMTSEFKMLKSAHDDMLSAYRSQSWAAALTALQEARNLAADMDLAGMYDMYEERIAALQATPPGPNWNAVYEAKSKG